MIRTLHSHPLLGLFSLQAARTTSLNDVVHVGRPVMSVHAGVIGSMAAAVRPRFNDRSPSSVVSQPCSPRVGIFLTRVAWCITPLVEQLSFSLAVACVFASLVVIEVFQPGESTRDLRCMSSGDSDC